MLSAVMDRLVSGVVPPTTPLKVVAAVPELVVRLYAPFTVLLKVMALFVVLTIEAPPSTTGLLSVTTPVPPAVILLSRVIVVPAQILTFPAAVMAPVRVVVPLSWPPVPIEMLPPPVAVRLGRVTLLNPCRLMLAVVPLPLWKVMMPLVKSRFGRLPLLDPLLRLRPPLPTLRLPFNTNSPVPLPVPLFPATRVSDPPAPVVMVAP